MLVRNRVVLLLAAAALVAPAVESATVLQMNLEDLCQRADRIFRGTVLDVIPGSVTAGGGELPTVTYRFLVEESFKGSYTVKEDVQTVEIQMVGTVKGAAASGDLRAFSVLPDLPNLAIGGDHLLFATAPSAVGLSAAVGLRQGSFRVFSMDKEELAVNEAGNLGLFAGMNVDLPSSGPVPYSRLADAIRARVGQ